MLPQRARAILVIAIAGVHENVSSTGPDEIAMKAYAKLRCLRVDQSRAKLCLVPRNYLICDARIKPRCIGPELLLFDNSVDRDIPESELSHRFSL
ncbi:hypothetical protein D3C87_1843020 [compost metagenome]